MPRIVKDNAHGADGKRKPSKDNTDEASELVYRMVLPHPHGLVFLPTSSVRFETGQIAQPKKRKEKRKKRNSHIPMAWKDPSFPHRARPGWACYTAGRRTHASHVNGAPTHTRTYETQLHHKPPHPLWASRAHKMHISEPVQPDLHGGQTTSHTRTPVRVSCDSPMTGMRELLLSDRSRTRREEGKKQKHTTTNRRKGGGADKKKPKPI